MKVIERRVGDVEHRAAPVADQVVMEVEVGVVARRAPWDPRLGEQAEADEGLERAVDGGARNAGCAPSRDHEHLVDRRVLVVLEDGVEDRPALHGERKPLLAAEFLEPFPAPFPLPAVQRVLPARRERVERERRYAR